MFVTVKAKRHSKFESLKQKLYSSQIAVSFSLIITYFVRLLHLEKSWSADEGLWILARFTSIDRSKL